MNFIQIFLKKSRIFVQKVYGRGRRWLMGEMEASMTSIDMPANMENITNQSSGQSTGKNTRGAPKNKKERSAARSRPAARPHRKLDNVTLQTRIKDLEKKLSVLRSRTVILDDRLDAYKREDTTRKESD